MVDPAASLYDLMASWFTPSSLFIFINLVIGTIAITSRFATPKRQYDSPQLVRSPSLLNRVMSFNLGYYKHQPTFAEETQVVEPVQNHDSPRLVRAPSLLERVKSFNLGIFKPEHPNPDDPTQDQVGRSQEEEEEEEVDAKADDFIKRFKQQLRLQRLESILRYRDMLLKGKETVDREELNKRSSPLD